MKLFNVTPIDIWCSMKVMMHVTILVKFISPLYLGIFHVKSADPRTTTITPPTFCWRKLFQARFLLTFHTVGGLGGQGLALGCCSRTEKIRLQKLLQRRRWYDDVQPSLSLPGFRRRKVYKYQLSLKLDFIQPKSASRYGRFQRGYRIV